MKRLRPLVLPVMVAALAGYVVLHSPLRTEIARVLGVNSRGNYFFGSWLHVGRELDGITALVLIVAALLGGSILTGVLADVSYERPLIFALSTLALIVVPATVVAGVASATGTHLLRPPEGPLIAAIPAAALVVVGWMGGWRPRAPNLTRPNLTPLVAAVWALAGLLLITSVALSLTHPPNQGDALSYHAPLAVFFWQDGDLTSFLHRAPSFWALANPGTSELWYGLLHAAGGERLADLGQLPFAVVGAAAAYAFTRAFGLSTNSARLAAGAFLLAPIVVIQSGMQANDLAGAAMLMTLAALAAGWNGRRPLSRAVLIGLAVGLAVTTKLALLPGAAAVALVFVIFMTVDNRRAGRGAIAPSLGLFLLMLSVVVAPWWLRNGLRYGNPFYPANLPFLGRGIAVTKAGAIDYEFVPSRAAWPLYPFLEPHDDRSGFGALLAVGLLPGFLFAAIRAPRRPLILYVVLAIATIAGWWKFALHEPRFLLGLTGLGFAFLPWSLAALPHRARRAGVVVVALAAAFAALVTFDQGLLPIARQPNTRLAFYDRVWGVDPAAAGLPDRIRLLFNTGYGPGSSDYAAYYPLLGRSSKRVVVPLDRSDTTGSTAWLAAKMRRLCVGYAYVSALPEFRRAVERLYAPGSFDLVHESLILPGESSGARRRLYRPVGRGSKDAPVAIRRYLFRLRGSPACLR